MAEVISVLVKRNAERRGVPASEQALAADAALGDVAQVLCAIMECEADRHALAQLSTSLLALVPLVEREPNGTRALDELYEAARHLVHAPMANPRLVSERKQNLYATYGSFRAHVAAASARTGPLAATD
jgi:hypothetical protein